MTQEEEAQKAYAEAGVDLPELKQEQPDNTDAPKEEPIPAKEQEEEPKALLTEEKPLERKRSIYDEYKDKKSELKSATERLEQTERERDEFRAKYEALAQAKTPEEHRDAQDELEAFAAKIEAKPEVLREMRELFLKGLTPNTDPDLSEKLKHFEEWQAQNAQTVEKQMFEQEFQQTVPALKELLPNASDEEMQAVKGKLDELSHTAEYHDKPLDYIAWKNKATLSALISPHKRGVETKGRVDISDVTFEFDPNADYSKMSLAQREKWEAEYKKMTSPSELTTDGDGRRVML
jgi:AcrR family transcriptional regulator